MSNNLKQKDVAIHHADIEKMNDITETLLSTSIFCFNSYKMIVTSFLIFMVVLITSFFLAFDIVYVS